MDVLKLIDKYNSLNISSIQNHEKFNLISIVHHSTRIEGSSLSEIDTQLLLDEGLTPKGKPIGHSLMARDHYTALLFVLETAKEKKTISIELIQKINSLVVKNTGSIYLNTPVGSIDSSTGALRQGNVLAGATYFPTYDQVPFLIKELILEINDTMQQDLSDDQKIDLSFDAHYKLVAIHPFYDGNGRTSRLLMNYIQAYYNFPFAIIHNESKKEYIEALQATDKNQDIRIFRNFMRKEYAAFLQFEIKRVEEMLHPKKDRGFKL